MYATLNEYTSFVTERVKKEFFSSSVPVWLILQYDNRELSHIDVEFMRRNQSYAKQHGYEYLFLSEKNDDLPHYWIKVKETQDLLNTGKYKGILWLDTDAVIVQPNRTLDSFFSDTDNKHMVISRDTVKWGHGEFNAGVWIIKNSDEGRQLMKEWMETYQPDTWWLENGVWKSSGPWSDFTYEQGSFIKYMIPKRNSWIHYVDWDVFQDVQPTEKSFALHFSASQKDYRDGFLARH